MTKEAVTLISCINPGRKETDRSLNSNYVLGGTLSKSAEAVLYP